MHSLQLNERQLQFGSLPLFAATACRQLWQATSGMWQVRLWQLDAYTHMHIRTIYARLLCQLKSIVLASIHFK